MNKFKKTFIGFGVVLTSILIGSGYQYLDHKRIFDTHKGGLLHSKPIYEKGVLSLSIVKINGNDGNLDQKNIISYSNEEVENIIKNLSSKNNNKVITSCNGEISFFNKNGGTSSFNGNGFSDNNNVKYRIETHFENNSFSTRIYLENIFYNKKDINMIGNSLIFTYSIPYTDKTTIIKIPWNIDTNSYNLIIFKINRV